MKPHLIMLLQEHGYKLNLPGYVFRSKDTELLLQSDVSLSRCTIGFKGLHLHPPTLTLKLHY